MEQSIKRRIMDKAQEARLLVKPLVGEWACIEDSDEEILRTFLGEMTGKISLITMGYDQLKYTIDLMSS